MAIKPVTEMERALATAVLTAEELYQLSYNTKAADAAKAEQEEKGKAWALENPDRDVNPYHFGIQYDKFYGMTRQEACEKACEKIGPALGLLIDLAYHWSNDLMDWAERVLDPTATCSPTLNNCQHGFVYPEPPSNDPNEDMAPVDIQDALRYDCLLCEEFYKKLRARRGDDEEGE